MLYPTFSNTPISQERNVLTVIPALRLEPLITVVTPAFNCGEIIIETAYSLLRQSFQRFKWIVIDDGSKDRTGIETLADALSNDERVEFVYLPENRGPSAARNRGIERSRTPFVCLLDSDDLLEPTALEKMLWFLLCHPQVAFTSGWEVGFQANQYLNPGGFDLGAEFLIENRKNISSLLRREVFDRVIFDEANRDGLEDWEFWISLLNQKYWGASVKEYLHWYRWDFKWSEKWSNWRAEGGVDKFRERLIKCYPNAFSEPFPDVRSPNGSAAFIPDNPVFVGSGHSVYRVDSAEQALPDGPATFFFTFEPSRELEEAAYQITSDIFVGPRFLGSGAEAQFESYLRASRQSS